MKYIKIFVCCAMLMGILHSCRQEDDFVKSYGGNNAIVMDLAKTSYTEQFDALWNAVNSNYVAWEIETVNWDDVYSRYYPKFVELDNTLKAKDDSITDEQFEALYTEILDTLHDGHSSYTIQNLYTKNYVEVNPQMLRNLRRFGKNANVSVPFDLSYYESELVPDDERFTEKCYNTSCVGVVSSYLEIGMSNIIKAYIAAQTPEEQTSLYKLGQTLKLFHDTIAVQKFDENDIVVTYNRLAAKYHDARMPQYNTEIPGNCRMQILSAISNDGIAYLRLSDFYLSYYFGATDKELSKMSSNGLGLDSIMIREVKNTWKVWYDAIQNLSAIGKLKGVIIDVRGNPGGMVPDHAFVLGALLPSGGHKAGTYKMKNGTGRLDYSADMVIEISTMSDEHAVIDDKPIVVLADHNSVSCSEMTAVVAKQLPNGAVIGSQTYGGMSMLLTGWKNYNTTYSGEFGVRGETPIYGYQPMCLASFDGYGVLEGVGVTPTEGYNMEYEPESEYNAQGTKLLRDNQLEAALKYIRNK